MSLPAIKGDAVIGLVNNAALLLALGILYDLILPRPGLRTPRLKALQGLLIGAIGVAVMFNPWKLTSDIVFDTRSVLLSIAGLFFGPIPASVAAIVTGAFRVFYHGGIGAIPGVAVITTATAIGLLWRHLRRRCASPPDWLELYAFGLIVHIVMLLCMLTLGWSAANRVNTTITVPVLLIYPIATVLLGSLLAHQQVRRRTEEALRREHALLERITEASPTGIMFLDLHGQITFANPFAERMMGLTRQQITQRTYDSPLWKVTDLDGNSIPVDQLPFARAKAANRPLFGERHIVHRPDGPPAVLATNAVPLQDEFGRFDGLVTTIEDITESLRAEQHIRRLNRVYAVLSNINQAIVRVRDPQALFEEACRIAVDDGGFRMAWLAIVDEQARELRVAASAGENTDYLENTRFSMENEPLGRGPTGTALREGRHVVVGDISTDPRMVPWRQKAMERGFRSSAAFPLIVFGKVRGTLNLYAGEPGVFDEEEVRLLDELAMDLSFAMEFAEQDCQRQRAEASLAESETRYRSLFENNHAVMLLVDPDSRAVIDANPAACAYYGWTREELTAKRIEEINTLSPDQIAAQMQLAQSQKRDSFAFQHRLADGSIRDVEVMSGPIQLEGKSLLYSIVHDISDRVRAKRERDCMEVELRQAQKMEAVGRLAGGVAHDFNNMLTVILGYADSTLRQIDSGNPLCQGILEIRNAAQRSADLTRQLLAFSRKQIVKPAAVNLNQNIASQKKMLSRLIGEDIRLDVVPADALWTIQIDPSQIDQILANLAINARDAIADAGTLTIETANVTLDETYSRRNLHVVPGDYVMLAVSDTGHGIAPEALEHIFEPFFTTKGEGHGTGLGLSTVYGIVKQNNGVIHAYSEPGLGTTFKIYLPRFQGRAEPAVHVAPAVSVDGHESILIVEDEEQILTLARAILEQHGYTVLIATTPAEACQIAEQYEGDIHLLLTDVVLPGMNGKQLQARIRHIKPGIKALFMSGYTANVIAHRGVLDEGVDFIQKPFSLEGLAGRVRSILDAPPAA